MTDRGKLWFTVGFAGLLGFALGFNVQPHHFERYGLTPFLLDTKSGIICDPRPATDPFVPYQTGSGYPHCTK
jgi:hypothetical protein